MTGPPHAGPAPGPDEAKRAGAPRLLVVCVGNICRSPMAEAVFRARLGDRGVAVESAGLAALVGEPADPLAESVLVEHGLSAGDHSARQVDPEMVNAADLVLVMEKYQIHAVHTLVPAAYGKTFLLAKWVGAVDIPDPFRRKPEYFSHVFHMIALAVDSWCNEARLGVAGGHVFSGGTASPEHTRSPA